MQAENDREEGISKDIAQAKKMDDDATADHTRKSTAKKQACATELEHLTTEKQTLESVVFHLWPFIFTMQKLNKQTL